MQNLILETEARTPEYEESLEKLRSDFYEKYKSNIDNGDFDDRDLIRLTKNLDWIEAFYVRSLKNHDVALSNLYETLKWRHETHVNDILKEENKPKEEHLRKGAMFIHGKDKNNLPIIYMVVRLYKKSDYKPEEVRHFLTYHFEQLYKFNCYEQNAIFFDMADCGFKNMDMDMVYFLVSCLRTYYPGLVAYLFAYKMPWIYEACWKLVKLVLHPELTKRIIFINEKTVEDFVDEKHSLKAYDGIVILV